VREREGIDFLVAKTISNYVTKLLRPGNIPSGVQNPFKSIKFTILVSLRIPLSERQEGEKRKTGDAATCTID